MATTGFVHHERYLWHDNGNSYLGMGPGAPDFQPYEHVEHAESKRRIRNLLEVSGLLEQLVTIKPRAATEEEILRFHTREYLENIKALSQGFGTAAGQTAMVGTGSYDIALLSAGGVIEAVDAVLTGRVNNAYALVRPPGHHAEPAQAMGFCLFGNAVIAGLHAFEKHGLDRIAYIDWDVHHGNGAQTAFWTDSRALTISLHQDNCFPPGSGLMTDNGEGAGEGYNINIPLPPGSGVAAYEESFDRVVIPALQRFKPDLIIVPSGLDAGAMDPMARMLMHSEGYRSLTAKLMAAADDLCEGRIVMCHEGGYHAPTVPFFCLAIMEQLSGIKTDVVDPTMDILNAQGWQELLPHQNEVIAQAEKLVANL